MTAQARVIPSPAGWPGSAELHPYFVCDVFTCEPLQGNQLGVVIDGRPFGPAQMQRLARELNVAETVFLFPPAEGGDVRVRIFTPATELPFAGHPVLGTAFVVAAALGIDSVTLETGAGLVPIALERDGDRLVFGRMRQPIPTWEPYERAGELLAALGAEEFQLPVELYRNGPPHVYVQLASEEAVAAVRPDLAALADLEVAVNCFAGRDRAWKTRMFYPSAGVPEGPGHRLGRRPAGHPPGPAPPDPVRRADRDPPGRGDRAAIGAVRDGHRRGRQGRLRRGRRHGPDRGRGPVPGHAGLAPPAAPLLRSIPSTRKPRASATGGSRSSRTRW